jgi:uncharacterized DUF497 family protein
MRRKSWKMNDWFEWDPEKARANLKKHGVSFEEAATVFADPMSFTVTDPLHSEDEDRFVITGHSILNSQLVVIHVHRSGKIRSISARAASPGERRNYERENRR